MSLFSIFRYFFILTLVCDLFQCVVGLWPSHVIPPPALPDRIVTYWLMFFVRVQVSGFDAYSLLSYSLNLPLHLFSVSFPMSRRSWCNFKTHRGMWAPDSLGSRTHW